jgi:hypothetical protein
VLVSPSGENNHYDIIDGQQRLTTFFLLLCALKHLFKNEPQYQTISGLISTSYTTSDGKINTSLKLRPCYENAGDLVSKIVELNADPKTTRNAIQSSGINSFGSLENLITAYGTIYRYLTDNYDNSEKLQKYWGYLATNVVFIQISTGVSNALKIFETINERGVGLNPMDLLKNLLFTKVNQEQFTQLKDEWKKITKPLEKDKEKPLRFLRYFLMANYPIKNKRGDSVVREDEIYDWLIDKENSKLCDYEKKPFEFVRKIINNVEHYLNFTNGRGNDGKQNIAMDNIRKLCGEAFSLHYVLLLAASNFPKPLFDYFVSQLESFLFYYIFTKTPTKDLERNFSVWADELRSIAQITDLIKQKKKLNDFIQEKFQKNMSVKDAELSDDMKRYSIDSMQKYRTHYLLAKFTQFVDLAYKGLKMPGSLDEYKKVEIEHILPNNPSKDLKNDFNLNNPGIDYDIYKNKLGNLTLLEKPINGVIGNNYFEKKKAEYTKSKFYLTSSISELTKVGKNSSVSRINQKLLSFDDWTAKSIDSRHTMLMNLSRDIWKIVPIDTE